MCRIFKNMKFEWKHIFKKLFKQLVPRMKIFRNYSVEVKLSNYCQTICRKQFCAILMRGKKRLSLNVFGESAVKSIFWWRIVSSCVTLLDKIWKKNLASDFHEPRAHLQVATVWVGVYVTTFCYLSLCEPMSAWISPYLTVLVFVSTNQRASSRKA